MSTNFSICALDRCPDADQETQDLWEGAKHDRLISLQRLLQNRGKFSKAAASAALDLPDSEPKELVARWLRIELKKLRVAEATPGASPRRREGRISRLEVADLAQTMLESIGGTPGAELLALMRELLNIDRHRVAIVKRRSNECMIAAFADAAGICLQNPVSVGSLAKDLEVSKSTIVEWRRQPFFREEVDAFVEILNRWGMGGQALAIKEQALVTKAGALDRDAIHRRTREIFVAARVGEIDLRKIT